MDQSLTTLDLIPTPLQSSVAPIITNQQPENFITTFPIPNPPSATAATSSTPPKTLWMGDIDPFSDEDTITQIWQALGKNVLVKLIKAKKGSPAATLNTGHAGYCFVEFQSHEDAKLALALNGTKIPNSSTRVFRLNWASSATLSDPIQQSPEYSLFVGDLAPTTTEAHLLSIFQQNFKTVKTVRVMTDPTTGASRCFGFVRFSDENERRDALVKMQGVWCAGRPIRVALATPRNSNITNLNNAAAAATMLGGPGGYSQDMMLYNMYPGPPSAMPYYGAPAHANGSFHNYADTTNTTVFIGGLSNGVPESTLQALFQPYGAIVNVKIPAGKGCGFVKFSRRKDAEAAISGMQGFTIGDSRVRLSWGRSQTQIRPSSGSGYPGNDGGFLGGFGTAPDSELGGMLPLGSTSNSDGYMYGAYGTQPDINYYRQYPGYQYEESSYPTEDSNEDRSDQGNLVEIPDGKVDDEKLNEMYKAAAAGKLDSL